MQSIAKNIKCIVSSTVFIMYFLLPQVVDTFAIQDKTGTIVQPIKTICSFYDATCLIQVNIITASTEKMLPV